MMSGANRDDYHLRNVTPGEDFHPEYADVRMAETGEHCIECNGMLEFLKGIQIARTRTVQTSVRVLTEDAHSVAPQALRSDFDLEITLVALAERFADHDGLVLPAVAAPFTLVITAANYADAVQREAADLLYESCSNAGISALLDDRDERPGVKFKDADLIGVPYRITVGKKLAAGKVEVLDRRTRVSSDVLLHDAVSAVEIAEKRV
jgi:prolyl-tRNA synthetase